MDGNFMASVQEPGMVEIWAKRVDGTRKRVFSGSVGMTAPAGGAPDGAHASVQTPEKRIFLNASTPILRPDDVIEVVFIADGADGIDVSDSIWAIPVTEISKDGKPMGTKFLGQGQFANPAPADYTTVAAIPVIVGGYKVTEAGLMIGGGPLWLDMQDDTA